MASARQRAPSEPRSLDHRAAASVLARAWEPGVTMAQVAATLGLAKPTLYRLARSKEDLVRACVEAEAERLLDYLHEALAEPDGAHPQGVFVAGLKAVERYAADSPGGFALLFEHRGHEATQALGRVEARLATLLRGSLGGADGELARADLLAAALLGASAGVVSRALAQGGGIDERAVADGVAAALAGA